MSSKSIYIPYTYLIGWSNHNKWYYGVRFARDCNPNDLWKTYFTSSKVVKAFRKKHGEPDIIQIRKTFSDYKESCLWEAKVLKRMKVTSKDMWLNIAGSAAPAHMYGGQVQSDLAKRRIKNGTSNIIEWNKEKVVCPKCGKMGQKRAMKRWHFDNCGIKRERSEYQKKKHSDLMKKMWREGRYDNRNKK